MRDPETDEDHVVVSVWPLSEEVGEEKSHSGVIANPSPGELELDRVVDGAGAAWTHQMLNRS